MIELSEIRVFLCTIPTRMNYSFDGLMGLAQQIFEQDPLLVLRDWDKSLQPQVTWMTPTFYPTT